METRSLVRYAPRDLSSAGKLACSLLLIASLILTLLAVNQRTAVAQANPVIVGELRVTPTLDHIGVVWFVEGDANLNSSMSIEFRRVGESVWRPGAPALRAEPNVIVDGSPLGINSWAASAMFLERGASYEVQATITDPDGGGSTQIMQATTRTLAQPGPTLRYVEPGSGGGSGDQGDPFLGLQAAADSANPGDTFVVASGVYVPFTLSASGSAGATISFVAADGAEVIVDGGGTSRGIMTLASTSHVIVSGLTLRNGAWGIDAQNTQDLVISNNTITDVDFGVYNRRESGVERHQVVCDNVIEGRTPWPASGIPGERGIDLRGWGNTICNNTVSNFGDCISMQPLHGPSFGNDIFGNDSNRCVDDGIEIDYNQANVRVYRNRVTNSRTGVSVQPIHGGPAYIFRNELINLETSAIKLNNGPSGLFVAHNTGIKEGNALRDGAAFSNTVFRNNVFIGTRYAFEFLFENPDGRRDFDYNAWGSTRADDWFKWDDVRYARIADLPNGVEDNGVEANLGSLAVANISASWDVEVAVGSQDLRPSAGSAVINAGAIITNINEPFVSDGAPDLGAFEAGAVAPSYGPGTPVITAPTGPPVVPPTSTELCNGQLVTIDMNVNGGDGTGTSGADVILGTPGRDFIRSGDGDDVICSGDGNDVVVAGTGNDTVIAGPGNDVVATGGGDDTVTAGPGNDLVRAGDGADTVAGGEGNDQVRAGAGNDVVDGGPGRDRIFGLDGDDTINGGDDPDTIYGNAGNDLLLGDSGADKINGGSGQDSCPGGADGDITTRCVPDNE